VIAMNWEAVRSWFETHKLGTSDYEFAVSLAHEFESMWHKSIDAALEADLDRYIAHLLTHGKSTIPAFRAMMRLMRFSKRNELFVHLTKYTGGLGVLESIQQRLRQTVGVAKANLALVGFVLPPLGTPPSVLPRSIDDLMARLRGCFDETVIHDVLADNHHGIPKQAFLEEKVLYETSSSLEAYLKEAHDRQIAVLEIHRRNNEVWFEQQITEEVLAFVKGNQEVLSARLDNDTLYMTKIPYDTKAYLEAKDSASRRYYACHCPFARESIRRGDEVVDPHWCSCSAGFHKYPYEILFDTKLSIRCLANALEADTLCRFAIDLRPVDYLGKLSIDKQSHPTK
jgi:hypothetical protein